MSKLPDPIVPVVAVIWHGFLNSKLLHVNETGSCGDRIPRAYKYAIQALGSKSNMRWARSKALMSDMPDWDIILPFHHFVYLIGSGLEKLDRRVRYIDKIRRDYDIRFKIVAVMMWPSVWANAQFENVSDTKLWSPLHHFVYSCSHCFSIYTTCVLSFLIPLYTLM